MNKTDIQYRPVRTSVELSGDAVKTSRVGPPKDLAPYVMDFWQYDVNPANDYIPIQVYPSGCLVIRFNIRPDHVESVLYGPSMRNSMRGLFYHDWVIFGVALHPQAAYHLLGISLDELRDMRIHLDCFWPKLTFELEERLWLSTSFSERVELLSGFLIQVIRADLRLKGDFLNAFQDILRHAPNAEDIGYIAKRQGTSGRTLRRHFLKYLGVGPKQMDRLFRVQRSMRTLCEASQVNLSQVALDNGFSDQSHFTREFRSLVGWAPSDFLGLKGGMHDLSLPFWDGLHTDWRDMRSPKIMRFT